MRRKRTITIKELHAHTGMHVRRASKTPVRVTDRGELVAVLVGPHSFPPTRPNRKLLADYEALLANFPQTDVLSALSEDRNG